MRIPLKHNLIIGYEALIHDCFQAIQGTEGRQGSAFTVCAAFRDFTFVRQLNMTASQSG